MRIKGSRSWDTWVYSYSLLVRTEIWVIYPKNSNSSARQHRPISFSPCDNCRTTNHWLGASHKEKTQRQPHAVKQRASVSNPKRERMLQCSSPQLTSFPNQTKADSKLQPSRLQPAAQNRVGKQGVHVSNQDKAEHFFVKRRWMSLDQGQGRQCICKWKEGGAMRARVRGSMSQLKRITQTK